MQRRESALFVWQYKCKSIPRPWNEFPPTVEATGLKEVGNLDLGFWWVSSVLPGWRPLPLSYKFFPIYQVSHHLALYKLGNDRVVKQTTECLQILALPLITASEFKMAARGGRSGPKAIQWERSKLNGLYTRNGCNTFLKLCKTTRCHIAIDSAFQATMKSMLNRATTVID
jgi:hypothetical protein